MLYYKKLLFKRIYKFWKYLKSSLEGFVNFDPEVEVEHLPSLHWKVTSGQRMIPSSRERFDTSWISSTINANSSSLDFNSGCS
jgi:hypothetical protein